MTRVVHHLTKARNNRLGALFLLRECSIKGFLLPAAVQALQVFSCLQSQIVSHRERHRTKRFPIAEHWGLAAGLCQACLSRFGFRLRMAAIVASSLFIQQNYLNLYL